MMRLKLPHEVFELSDDDAVDCLCLISDYIEEDVSPYDIIKNLPEKCRLFGAYELGYYIGLSTEFENRGSGVSMVQYMRLLSDDVESPIRGWIKLNKFDEKLRLNEDQIVNLMWIITQVCKIEEFLNVIKYCPDDVKVAGCFIIGYLDGLADETMNPFVFRRRLNFLAWLRSACKDKGEVKSYFKRLRWEEMEARRDVV